MKAQIKSWIKYLEAVQENASKTLRLKHLDIIGTVFEKWFRQIILKAFAKLNRKLIWKLLESLGKRL